MQTDIRTWCGVCPVDRQAGTALGPQPQKGPPSTTGGNSNFKKRDTEQKDSMQFKDQSILFSQWNAEGVRLKKLLYFSTELNRISLKVQTRTTGVDSFSQADFISLQNSIHTGTYIQEQSSMKYS